MNTSLSIQSLIKDCIKHHGRLSPNLFIQSLSLSVLYPLIEKRLGVINSPLKHHVILILSKHVMNDQIMLEIFNDDQQNDYDYVVFIIFHVSKDDYVTNVQLQDKESYQSCIHIKNLYMMKRDQFQALTFIKHNFKSIHLTRQCINLKEEENHKVILHSNESSSLSSSFNESKNAIKIQYQPFSLYHHMNMDINTDSEYLMNQSNHDFINYMHVISDNVLFYALSKKLDKQVMNRLKLKLLQRLNYSEKTTAYKSQVFIDFLIEVIRFSFHYTDITKLISSHTTQVLSSNDKISYLSIEQICHLLPMTKEIVNTELFLFKNCEMNESFIDSFHSLILQHKKQFIDDVDHYSFHSSWFDYHFNDDNNNHDNSYIWKLDNETGQYKLRYEWLLMVNTMIKPIVIEKGLIYIHDDLMKKVFLPLIYQCILHDIIIYTFYMHIYKRQCHIHYHKLYLNNSSNVQHVVSLLHELGFFNSKTLSDDLFFEFSLLYDNHSSYVIRKWMKEVESKQMDVEPIIKPLNTRPSLYSNLPDIEDIISCPTKRTITNTLGLKRKNNDILPPCMRKVMNLDHLKHLDRLNMVKYFYLLGYSEEKIIDILDGKVSRNDIKILFRECENKSKSGEFKMMRCGSLMNLNAPEGNVLQCYYEERQRHYYKPKKRYDYNEKKQFIHECFGDTLCSSSSSYPLSFSPIDYIRQKMHQ